MVDIDALLRRIHDEHRSLTEEMPFAAYLERAAHKPRLARRAHALVHDAILHAGTARAPDGEPRYLLFSGHLFGIDPTIRAVVDHFAAAAADHDARRRILLLLGPPGSGKSTLVNLLKAGLEGYTRTSEGAVYAIAGCPIHEQPLHLLPPDRRADLPDLDVEGGLCPYCRWLVTEVHDGDVAEVPVRRVTFSTAAGVGIGTFVATDPRSQDLARLVGTVDPSLLEGGSPAAARRAFRLAGELNAANRGLADLVEALKMDERFLTVLLTLSEERTIKLSGPGTAYHDEAIVAQSNVAEYEALLADPRAAALRDRLVVVAVPYVLRVRDEVRIYRKTHPGRGDVHLSPLALPTAASFAVLTRLAPSRRSGWDLRRKLHLYDDRFVPTAGDEDRRVLHDEAPGEGLSGISPRFVLNQLDRLVARADGGCVGGRAVLSALWEALGQQSSQTAERDKWTELLIAAREEHDDLVRQVLRRAAVPAYSAKAATLAVDAHGDLHRWRESHTAEVPALRRLERALGVPEYRREAFRESLLGPLAATEYTPQEADPRLEEAIDRVLLPAWVEVARALRRDGDTTPLRRRLVDEHGFCARCAADLVTYAAELARPRRTQRGPLNWLTG